MFYNLIILPIETIVDWVFCFITRVVPQIGVIGAVAGVSLVINFLALPLYNIADSLQEKERQTAKSLEYRVKRIKKAFKGDEQFMMLQTYYRQNNYHPLYVLRSSLSILIEIPFFIAAYHYLSNCDLLKGSSFWIFRDLGSPDGLLSFTIGNIFIPVHVLPIVMTLINFISGAIYTKDAIIREKIQLYAMAVLFLVLLYTSPSGLVIYWILNNLFSLAKNIVLKTKNPKRILYVCICLIAVAACLLVFRSSLNIKYKIAFVLAVVILCLIPLIAILWNKKHPSCDKSENSKSNFVLFMVSSVGLALLCGFVLPSNVIASSPIEFSFLGSTDNPVAYVWHCVGFFAGLFVVWPMVIYFMFGQKVKIWMTRIFGILFVYSILNSFVFTSDYGNLNAVFSVGNEDILKYIDIRWILSAASVMLLVTLAIIVSNKKLGNLCSYILVSFMVAEVALGIAKCNKINYVFKDYSKSETRTAGNGYSDHIKPTYHLSKTKQNVVVIFLDRAIGTFVEPIFEEHPEIKNQYTGFVHYPNTLSFSDFTVQGAPPMMGGYEYTQEQFNRRSTEQLVDKHNESLLVMPRLFSDAGFATTITDPPWVNYKWSGDLSIFESYPDITASEVEGMYYDYYLADKGLQKSQLDVYCRMGAVDFSVTQILPPFVRAMFYVKMRRHQSVGAEWETFLKQLSTLYYLDRMTDFNADSCTFTFMENETTHEGEGYLDKDYEVPVVGAEKADSWSAHYYANIAALKQLGKWFDYLRDNNCYDNTRIVIVSDHGSNIDVPCGDGNVSRFGALLMFKDFDGQGDITEDCTFMTNADTLFLAKQGLNVSNVNPLTGKELIQDKDNGVNIYHCSGWQASDFLGKTQFNITPESGFHVKDNIFNRDNWTRLSEYKE